MESCSTTSYENNQMGLNPCTIHKVQPKTSNMTIARIVETIATYKS